MTDKLRAAAEAALEALERARAYVYETDRPQVDASMDALRAALADAEDDAWEVDYEVCIDDGDDEVWVAGASEAKEAFCYAMHYTDEGTVRVYERRVKLIATLEARND